MTKSNKKSTKKTIKKVSKKTVAKKEFTDIKPIKILNKKNALEFAEYLYSEKSDGKKQFASYVKMCTGSLKDTSTKKNPLSCILGEAYMYFVDPKFSEKDLDKEVDRHCAEVDKHNDDMYEDDSILEEKYTKYSETEDLVSYILVKNSTCKLSNVVHLKNELNNLPGVNDDSDEFVNRAKLTKEAWMKNVVPLLK